MRTRSVPARYRGPASCCQADLPWRDPTLTDTAVVHLGLQTMMIALKLGTPVLLTALVIGFAISLFQSVTQIQETTLSFVPKALGVALALLLSANWMLHELRACTTGLSSKI